MVMHEINVYIKPKLTTLIEKAWFRSTVNEILDMAVVTAPSELGLVITNNKVIQRLNKIYRDKDEPTDVLSFNMLSKGSNKMDGSIFITPPDGFSHLGEIVISYPQATIQAEGKGHDIKRELLILVIHGVLHLLGYDHENSAEEERCMRAKEDEILKMLTS
jgi:probable rRNA maturation factor